MSNRAFSFVRTNSREGKPRTRGLTEIRGPYYTPMGRRYLEDLLETMGAYVDSLKFAGGSFALMPTAALREIGNIYADEILFQARLHPGTKLDRLDARRLRDLYRATRRILLKGHRGRGESREVAKDVPPPPPRAWRPLPQMREYAGAAQGRHAHELLLSARAAEASVTGP